MKDPRRALLWFTRFFGCSVVVWLALASSVFAASRAVIVIGLSASESQVQRLHDQANLIREGLIARGLSPESIQILGPAPNAPIKRDAILAALASPSPAAPTSTDEAWIVLLGHSAPGRDDQPAFQVTGPRLTASDLAKAVGALPGAKYVVVSTALSGGFLPPLLALPQVEAAAATADRGEINEPRFGQAWGEALNAQPKASFSALAADAAQRVETFYKNNALAQPEHARLIDRAAGKILEAPFTKVASASSFARAPQAPAKPITADDIEIPKPTGGMEIEHRPASEETRAALAAANALAKNSLYPALTLREEAVLTVNADASVAETWQRRVFVRAGEAIDEVATFDLPSEPPLAFAELQSARVIRPDGAQVVINPRALAARGAAQHQPPEGPPDKFSRAAGESSVIELPEVTAGCIVEAAWKVERRAADELPYFYREWPIARPFPVLAFHLVTKVPKTSNWHTYAPQFSAPPIASETDFSRVQTWDLANLPAFEPLPGDPPPRLFVPWIAISSLGSWDDFAGWYRRLARGSEEVGPEVKKLAASIASTHADRAGRIRAVYEEVAALRYVALELGVGAFRPRTPEQVLANRYGDCKDKANLIVALLRELGVAAEFALVNRGDVTFTAFPGWQFNHAVAHVPAAAPDGQAEDLWLDATDRLAAFAVVPRGDAGRDALIVTPEKTFFKKIVPGVAAQSSFRETWTMRETADGTWTGTATLAGDGLADFDLRGGFARLGPAARRQQLREWFAARLPAADIGAPQWSDAFDLAHAFTVTVPFTLKRVAWPALRVPGFSDIFASEDRQRPIWVNDGQPLRFVQTVTLQPQDGHASNVAALPFPPALDEKSEGAYELSVHADPLSRQVTLDLKTGALAPERFRALRASLQTVSADSTAPLSPPKS